MHIKESAALNDYFFIPGQHNEFILHLFMKKIIGFIRDYFIEVDKRVFSVSAFFIAVIGFAPVYATGQSATAISNDMNALVLFYLK